MTELEQQGLVHGFKFTHELSWNVLKDYLEEKGVSGIIGPKDAAKEASKHGLIEDGEVWMDMIKARSLSSHTYNPETADAIVEKILNRFYPAFQQMHAAFAGVADEAQSK